MRPGGVWKVEKEWDPVVPTDKRVVVNGPVDSIDDNIPDLDQILHQDMIGKAPLQSSIREYQHCC